MIIRVFQIMLILTTLFALPLLPNTALAVKPAPLSFKYGRDAAEVLRTYPLGVLNKKEVFSFHGAPIQKTVLPNGNDAWLYKVGEDVWIPNLYVVEFSHEGIVVDVLHKDIHYKNGHSALQYQYLINADIKSRLLGPGPAK